MVSPLAEINIGSPLPDSVDLIFKQVLDGSIEILDSTLSLHMHSSVVLRNSKQIHLDVLNGTWSYTPKYMDENVPPMSYTLGHMLDGKKGYLDLLAELTSKAEQTMFYGPHRKLRAFLLNHDKVTGKTDLLLPKEWSVVIDDNLKMQDFMGVIEGYVLGNARQAVTTAVYEQFYADIQNPPRPVRLVCRPFNVVIYPLDAKVRGRGQFDMTHIMRFISNPRGHGLTQEHLQAYRKLVNL